MKKIILSFSFFFFSFCYSQQDSFVMNDKEFTDYVVLSFPDKTAKELYTETIKWINKTYKKPDEVILGKIEDQYLRFEGSKSPFACKKILGSYTCEDGRYQIEVSFKDQKVKFDVIKIETYRKYDGFNAPGWEDFNMSDTSFYYKNGKIRSMYKSYPESFTKNINEIKDSLINYIISDNKESDNW